MTIYALVDPLSRDVRYVGKTNRPTARLIQHWQSNGWDRGSRLRFRWVRSLRKAGAFPEMIILEQCSEARASRRERRWISICDSPVLLNLRKARKRKEALR